MNISSKGWIALQAVSVAANFLWLSSTVFAQPPELDEPAVTYLLPKVEEQWQTLRRETGLQEFTAPQEAIKRYQQFYETVGSRSLLTGVQITSTIAQLYWQELKNRQKALEIYDQALKFYGDLPQVSRLQRERDIVAQSISDDETLNGPSTSLLAKVPPPLGEQPPLTSIRARAAFLAGYFTQWRLKRITWDSLVKDTSLTPPDALLALTSPSLVSGYASDYELRMNLMTLLRQSPDLIAVPADLPAPVQMAIAEQFTTERNPQAEKIYQDLLTIDVPSNAWWQHAFIATRLADHYASMDNYLKAAQTKLSILELTNEIPWQANALVEAARHYHQAGDIAKAKELYQRATHSNYGWANGLALHDQASALIAENRHDEARKLLNAPIVGQYTEQIQPALLALSAYSHYRTSDFEQSRRIGQEAIMRYKSLQNPLQNENLEYAVGIAYSCLEWIAQWERQPLVCWPPKINMTLEQDSPQKKIISQKVNIRTFPATVLSVTSDNPLVKVRLVDEWEENEFGYYFDKEMIIEIGTEALNTDFEAVVIVSDRQFPEKRDEIRVHVQASNLKQ